MDDIGDFTQRVVEDFCNHQESFSKTYEGRFKLDLPPRVVAEYVRAAFYASLIPDEGRYPTVCLMCYRSDLAREFHLPFRTPVPPMAKEIAKLAHAVGPSGHLYALCDQGRLMLAGIHVTFLNETRHLGYGSPRATNPLKLVIRGPGHIEVSHSGLALIYKAGEITDERPLQHGDVMRAMVQAMEQELAGQTNGTVELLEAIFNDVAKAIVRLRHGGMLILGKDPDMGQFSSPRETDSAQLRNLLVRYWNDARTLLTAAGGLGNLQNEQVQQAESPLSLKLASDTTMLENFVTLIGHLAGMDGAIVMDYRCNLLAFNAIIDKSARGGPERRLVEWCGRDIPEEAVVKDRGSRHKSALLYAKRVTDCFVFVISQEGGVTAFHNRGDGRVLCEQNLRVLD